MSLPEHLSLRADVNTRRVVDQNGNTVANLNVAFSPSYTRPQAEAITRLLTASVGLYKSALQTRPVLIKLVAQLSKANQPSQRAQLRKAIEALEATRKTLDLVGLSGGISDEVFSDSNPFCVDILSTQVDNEKSEDSIRTSQNTNPTGRYNVVTNVVRTNDLYGTSMAAVWLNGRLLGQTPATEPSKADGKSMALSDERILMTVISAATPEELRK